VLRICYMIDFRSFSIIFKKLVKHFYLRRENYYFNIYYRILIYYRRYIIDMVGEKRKGKACNYINIYFFACLLNMIWIIIISFDQLFINVMRIKNHFNTHASRIFAVSAIPKAYYKYPRSTVTYVTRLKSNLKLGSVIAQRASPDDVWLESLRLRLGM